MATSTSTAESITLYTAAHGSADITSEHLRRSSNPHEYPDNFKTIFLSFAGLAHITTLMGINSEGTGPIAKKLRDKGSDYGTLAYLVPKIFEKFRPTWRKQPDLTDARIFMEYFREEIMKLGKDLADLEFSKTSPPVILENPQFDKRWWFADNAGHNRRKRIGRSGISRGEGDPKYNPIMAIPGLYVLQTSRDELKRWSLSDITLSNELTADGFLTMHAIQKRNLLRKINYTSFWRRYINEFDFSNVPDVDVVEIDNVTEAVLILQQIYYAVNGGNGIDDPHDEAEINRFVDEADEDMLAPPDPDPSLSPPPPPPAPPTKIIIEMLKTLLVHRDAANIVIALVKDANENVSVKRSEFVKEADRADSLEEEIKGLNATVLTRHKKEVVGNMTTFLDKADKELDELRGHLDEAKKNAARLESELDDIKSRIVADVVTFIGDILHSKDLDHPAKAVIKNIIMRNKLKNILKMGILHKVLRLRQVMIFFRGLRYNILNIVDPSCFVLRKPDPPCDVPDTQGLPDSQGGLGEEVGSDHTQVKWVDELNMLTEPTSPFKRLKPVGGPAGPAGPAGSAGGTKRKRSTRSYSRKRHVFRRNKRTKKHRYYTKRRKI